MENVIRLVEQEPGDGGIKAQLLEIINGLPDDVRGQAIVIVRTPGEGVGWHGIALSPLEAVGLCEVTKAMMIEDTWEVTDEA